MIDDNQPISTGSTPIEPSTLPENPPVTPDSPPPQPASPSQGEPSVDPPFPIQTPPSPSDQPPSSPPPPPLKSPPPSEPEEVIQPLVKRFLPLAIGIGILIVIVLIITKFILPAIKKPKEPETVSLKYWGLWEPESIVSQVINDYRKDHPNVTIQYVRQSPKDYRERLQSALAKGDGPDIFRWHNTWLPMLKNDLAPVPNSIYSSTDFGSIFYPIINKDVSFQGKHYGIPLEFDALALYVNEDIFAQNPDVKVPDTWDNLRQTAFKLKKLDSKGNTKIGGVAMGTTNNVDHFSDILGLMILQNGGDPGKPEDKTISSALKFYTLFSSQDKSWSDALPNSTLAFANEQVAMIIAPSWRALEIKQLNPQLNFELYPVPQLPGTNIAWATYWIEGVSQKSLSQEAAFEFLKYLSSKPVLTKMYNLASQSRLFGEPYSRQDMAASLQEDPFVGAVLTQAISAQSWPLVSNTFDNGINDKLIKYYEDAVNSYNKLEGEKKIIDNLSQGVSQVILQYDLSK